MVVYSVPEQVFMALYKYIQDKPFSEVNQLVAALNSSVQRVEVPNPTPAAAVEQPKNEPAGS